MPFVTVGSFSWNDFWGQITYFLIVTMVNFSYRIFQSEALAIVTNFSFRSWQNFSKFIFFITLKKNFPFDFTFISHLFPTVDPYLKTPIFTIGGNPNNMNLPDGSL